MHISNPDSSAEDVITPSEGSSSGSTAGDVLTPGDSNGGGQEGATPDGTALDGTALDGTALDATGAMPDGSDGMTTGADSEAGPIDGAGFACTAPMVPCDVDSGSPDAGDAGPYCADLTTDMNNCGACGAPCTTKNGTPTCKTGTCGVLSCNAGFGHCSTSGTDCETNTNTDVNNCGTCGKVCMTQNGTPTCKTGMCGVLSCNAGFGHCAASGSDCETPLNTVSNCGTCGAACTTANGTPGCSLVGGASTCVAASCNAGFANCPGNGHDCSTDTNTDVNNCGGCGKVCTTQNGTPTCSAGMCGVLSCNAGYGHCSGSGTDCETPLNTVSNCGTCGAACTTLNGTPACNLVGGVRTCGVASCNAGFGNCSGGGHDCATNINTDNNNCGACGSVCNANTCGGAAAHVSTTGCSTGHCGIVSCLASWQDTNLTCSDGCECHLSTVPSTCGAGAYSLGMIAVGGAPASNTSNLFPAAPNAAYYTVTFTGNTNTSFHPRITLTDPLNEFVMDITSDCSALESSVLTCSTAGDATASQGVTSWDTSYAGPTPGADPNVYPVTGSHFQPIVPANGGTVYIKVYRKAGVTNCNNAYTITASG